MSLLQNNDCQSFTQTPAGPGAWYWLRAEVLHGPSDICGCHLPFGQCPVTGGYPPIEDVAQLLQTSPRTLQRRLNEAGVSYSDLVERCRRHNACEALRFTRDSIRVIAAAQGYRDVSSFSRAFRRWTGAAPRAWRNQWLSPRSDNQEARIGVN
ncbi:MAG: helix-turn-helix domain-containing protein [Thiogranum sp.]